jgi:glycosyltransferase involved in cell wall biosynthesis
MRVLCIGNGALIQRSGQLFHHGFLGEFLVGLAAQVGDVRMCGWINPVDDPLAQTCLDALPGVSAVGLPYFSGPPVARLRNGMVSLWKIVVEVARADFVYIFWPGTLQSIVALLCRRLGKPYGVYLRGEPQERDGDGSVILGKAQFVLTTGERLRALAAEFCRDVETVTPMNYIRPEHVRPPVMRDPEGRWRLVYVGRVEVSKGVNELVEAVSYLDQKGIPVELTLVGHCDDPAAFMRRVPAEIVQHVKLAGGLSDFDRIAEHYRASDIFVLASHHEGFPRVLYESMAFGLPIVTTFVGGIPSTMTDGENCLRIEVNDPRDIADKVEILIRRPELRRAIAQGGHRLITRLMQAWRRTHAIQVAERIAS